MLGESTDSQKDHVLWSAQTKILERFRVTVTANGKSEIQNRKRAAKNSSKQFLWIELA